MEMNQQRSDVRLRIHRLAILAVVLSVVSPVPYVRGGGLTLDLEPPPGREQPSSGSSDAHQQILADLEARVAEAATQGDQALAEAAWANELLAHACPEALSRLVLGVDSPEDIRNVEAMLQKAADHLDRARALLDEAQATTTPDDEIPAARLKALPRKIEQLSRLAAAVKALTLPRDADEAGKEQAVQAARDLAVARESEDPQIAAAALFWQSAAWVSGGRADRALKSLPSVTEAPEQWPWDFYAIILRCRVLQKEGRPAAALALAIQIDSRSSSWTDVPVSSEVVTHTAKRLQLTILDRWLQNEMDSRSRSARDNLEAIRKSILSETESQKNVHGDDSMICPFVPAVPLLLELPELTQETASSTTRPDSALDEENHRPITTTAPSETSP